MSPPVIRQVLSHTKNSIVNIIDSPPGTSCPAISSIKEADYVLLVTEPTPFGLNDLALAIEMVKEVGLPFSVIINRSDPLTQIAHDFCKQRSADIIAEIPDNRHIAELCSEGELFCKNIPEYKDLFRKIWKDITSKAPRIQDYK
jgi:MinD superfamily P-loop ATPase